MDEDEARMLLGDRNFPLRITNTKQKIFYDKEEVVNFMKKRNAKIKVKRNQLIFIYDETEHYLKGIPRRLREVYVCQK